MERRGDSFEPGLQAWSSREVIRVGGLNMPTEDKRALREQPEKGHLTTLSYEVAKAAEKMKLEKTGLKSYPRGTGSSEKPEKRNFIYPAHNKGVRSTSQLDCPLTRCQKKGRL